MPSTKGVGSIAPTPGVCPAWVQTFCLSLGSLGVELGLPHPSSLFLPPALWAYDTKIEPKWCFYHVYLGEFFGFILRSFFRSILFGSIN